MRYQLVLSTAAWLSAAGAHTIFLQLESGGTQYGEDILASAGTIRADP